MDCKSMLQESNPLTKKELLANWDSACLTALQFKCEKCGHVVIPNAHIYLRIHDARDNKDYDPKMILPKPANPVDINKMKNVRMSDFKE